MEAERRVRRNRSTPSSPCPRVAICTADQTRSRWPLAPEWRRKLLRLYYADKIGADLFAEEEARLSVALRAAQRGVDDARVEVARSDDVALHFDAVAHMLATLDVDKTWNAATEVERRVLIDEFIEEISVLPDYLDVKGHGAPPLHVRYQEVGMKDSEF